jgi:hypothetical protein
MDWSLCTVLANPLNGNSQQLLKRLLWASEAIEDSLLAFRDGSLVLNMRTENHCSEFT